MSYPNYGCESEQLFEMYFDRTGPGHLFLYGLVTINSLLEISEQPLVNIKEMSNKADSHTQSQF